jgi:excisionase family DNA binding protein
MAAVTEKTIRRWIKSGRLHAVKLGGQYRITAADLESAQAAISESDVQGVHSVSTQSLDTGHDSPGVDISESLDSGHRQSERVDIVDLAPLTDLIDDLTRRNADLAAAAAMWQTRAAHLENELKQLTAGDSQPDAYETATEAPESPQRDDPEPTGILAWWKRLWGG